MFVTFYREVYEASMSFFGQTMRALEIVAVAMYLGVILASLNYYTIWMNIGKDFGDLKKLIDENKYDIQPECLSKQSAFKTWSANVIEWIFMELIVFVLYLSTMVFMLIKSRCFKIGVDQSGQFEAVYIQKMIDKIVLSIDFKMRKSKAEQEIIIKQLGKKTELEVEGIKLKVRIDREECINLKNKLIVETKEGFVEIDKAQEWI